LSLPDLEPESTQTVQGEKVSPHSSTARDRTGLMIPAGPAINPASEAASASCRIESLEPASIPSWTRYLHTHPDGTLFHTAAWRSAVAQAFGHRSIYCIARRQQRIVGGLPMFLVNSRFGGRMLVSVPYGVGGGVLADDVPVARALFDAAKSIACKHHCTSIDLRHEHALIPGIPVVDRYVGFRRELPDRVGDVLPWLPRKARAAARNARKKYGLRIEFSDEYLRLVWRLYTLGMRRLASLNYPFVFIKRLVECTPNRHWVCLVRWRGRPVAGLITFLFKDRVMPYFFGATRRATRCHAANYAYLCVMERAVTEGYRVFDFGRSRRDNVGCVNFKRFNGFEPQPLHYQRYLLPGAEPVDLTPTSRRFRLARRIWPWLPLSITRPIGARLTYHLPG